MTRVSNKLVELAEKAIKAVEKTEIRMIVSEGVVITVDKDARTCSVDREDLPDLPEVRLNAVLEAGDDVLTIFPTVGSIVLVAMIEDDKADAYMLSCNDIESIEGNIGTQSLKWNKDGFVFNEGSLNGMVKHDICKTNLESIKAYVTTLKTATATIAVALDALVPGTSKAFNTAMSTVSITLNDMENTNIKQ